MTTLIIGYPGSGKSMLAEKIAEEQSADRHKLYLATMIPYGDEGLRRVERHRSMRAGKGFITLEAPYNVTDALIRWHEAEGSANGMCRLKDCTVLLECVSNLAANLLFELGMTHDEAERAALDDIRRLQGITGDLIIVSNHYEDDGNFDQETAGYAELLDRINSGLESAADRTILMEDLNREA